MKNSSMTSEQRRELSRIAGRKAQELCPEIRNNGYGHKAVADGILFKSLDEVTFYEVVRFLGGQPEYEPYTIGRYHPDFVLRASVLDLPAGRPLELKPERGWRKYRGRQEIPSDVEIVYAEDLWESS